MKKKKTKLDALMGMFRQMSKQLEDIQKALEQLGRDSIPPDPLKDYRSIKEDWDLDPPYKRIQDKPKCAKCGIELDNLMMYSCPQTQCPSGLGSRGILVSDSKGTRPINTLHDNGYNGKYYTNNNHD